MRFIGSKTSSILESVDNNLIILNWNYYPIFVLDKFKLQDIDKFESSPTHHSIILVQPLSSILCSELKLFL
jgi:hypothetical protein